MNQIQHWRFVSLSFCCIFHLTNLASPLFKCCLSVNEMWEYYVWKRRRLKSMTWIFHAFILWMIILPTVWYRTCMWLMFPAATSKANFEMLSYSTLFMINGLLHEEGIQSALCGEGIICVTCTALVGERCCRQPDREWVETEINIVQTALTSTFQMPKAPNNNDASTLVNQSSICAIKKNHNENLSDVVTSDHMVWIFRN